jgi:hypothetical protein
LRTTKKPVGNLNQLPATQEAFNALLEELKTKRGSAGDVEMWMASRMKEVLRLMVQETLEQQEKS